MRKATIAALAAALRARLRGRPGVRDNGYFAAGYGTHYKAMAGAGAALHLEQPRPGTNPAAVAFLGPRSDASLALFNPNRSYTVTGSPSGFPGTFGLTPGRWRATAGTSRCPRSARTGTSGRTAPSASPSTATAG